MHKNRRSERAENESSFAANRSNRRAICTVTTKVSQELYEEVYNAWDDICKRLPAGCVLHYMIQPMGKAGVQAGRDRGENILGLESVSQCCKYPLYNGTYISNHVEPR